jgi:hypothetical protein
MQKTSLPDMMTDFSSLSGRAPFMIRRLRSITLLA